MIENTLAWRGRSFVFIELRLTVLGHAESTCRRAVISRRTSLAVWREFIPREKEFASYHDRQILFVQQRVARSGVYRRLSSAPESHRREETRAIRAVIFRVCWCALDECGRPSGYGLPAFLDWRGSSTLIT